MYCIARELAHQRGEEVRMDKAPILAHIADLQAQGWSVSQIARAAGKSQSTLSSVMCRPHKTVNRATGRAILAVTGPKRDLQSMTSALGSARRVRALYALGHLQARIAKQTGLHRDAIGDLLWGRTSRVTERHAIAIRCAYDVLSMELGDSDRNRATAKAQGWVPPLAWDEESIDNPRGRANLGLSGDGPAVDEAVVLRALRGDRVDIKGQARRVAVEHGIRHGMEMDAVADVLGMKFDTVKRYWERAKEQARERGEKWPDRPLWTFAA
jgi:lambda repressor-like predicted transcriptional regulator